MWGHFKKLSLLGGPKGGWFGLKQASGESRGDTQTSFSEKNMSGHLPEEFVGPGGHF